MLAGVFYPISTLPAPWATVSQFNPIHHTVNLLRYGMIGYSDINPAISFGVSIAFALIVFAVMNRIAVRTLKH